MENSFIFFFRRCLSIRRQEKSKNRPKRIYIDFDVFPTRHYVGLYTAAAFHGAAHQQIQQDYIVTIPPVLRAIDKGNTRLQFLNTKHWPKKNIIKQKSDAGLFNVSSAALTAADLVFHHSKIGGINRIMANLEELAEEIEENDMIDLISWYPHVSALQRLGYLLEEIGVEQSVLNQLEKKLFQVNPHYALENLLRLKTAAKSDAVPRFLISP